MKYPKTFFTLAILAIFSLILTTATAQDSGTSILEAPVVATPAPVSSLENPLVTTTTVTYATPIYAPVIYTTVTPLQRFFTRTATVPVVTTSPLGQVTSVGYRTANVRAAIFPRLKAQRLANGYAVQAQAVSTSTVLVQ